MPPLGSVLLVGAWNDAERLFSAGHAVEFPGSGCGQQPARTVLRRSGGNGRPARILRTAQWTREHLCGQVTKGARWMPRHQEPKKDVGGCDKPRGAANRAVIRGSPNGETRQESCPVTHA